MTDLDAAAYLKELADYNMQGAMSTPANQHGPDTFFDCAMQHAIRALEAAAKVTDVHYYRNPNGSYSPKSYINVQDAPCRTWHRLEDEPAPDGVPVFIAWRDIYGKPHADATAVCVRGKWYWYEGSPQDSSEELLVPVTHWRQLPDGPNPSNTIVPPPPEPDIPGWYLVDTHKTDGSGTCVIEIHAESKADAIRKIETQMCGKPGFYGLEHAHNARLAAKQPDLEPDQVVMKLD